jgi:hypothetical protein
LASAYYATLALRSRQLDLRPAFRRANASAFAVAAVSEYTGFRAGKTIGYTPKTTLAAVSSRRTSYADGPAAFSHF